MALLTTGAAFVLTSVALCLAGNRWANYIMTPIPGVFFVDALFAAGALVGLIRVRDIQAPRAWLLSLFGAIWFYAALILIPEIVLVDSSDRYNAIRDAAPFLYLGLAPFVAVPLMRCSMQRMIWVLRVSSLGVALLTIATYLGWLRPISSPIMGSEFARLFESRLDLVGAAIGIGILAWGAWSDAPIAGSVFVQGGLLVAGVALVENRSGALALLFATICAVVRLVCQRRSPLPAVIALGLLAIGLTLQVTYHTPIATTSSALQQTTTIQGKLDQWTDERVLRQGTSSARISTWFDIIQGMYRDQTWLLGGAGGSDYMYELCTGIPEAPEVIMRGPKCAIDDSGPNPVVRDPHNWVLNIVLYHGVVGLAIFLAVLFVPMWLLRHSPTALLPILGIFTYLVAGTTFIISAGYALIPITFLLALLVRNSYSTSRRQHDPDVSFQV